MANLLYDGSIALRKLAVLLVPDTLRRRMHDIGYVHELVKTGMRCQATKDVQDRAREFVDVGSRQRGEGRESGESGTEGSWSVCVNAVCKGTKRTRSPSRHGCRRIR